MNKFIFPLLVVILLGIGGTALYLYNKVSALEASPDSQAIKESEDIIKKVGALIILPNDEVPTIATVSDIEKLKDQPFFAKAKEGDKVIMYPKSRKAYLYDPVNNKILEVAPISLDSADTTEITPTVQEEPTVQEDN